MFWQDFIHVLRPGDLHTLAQRRAAPTPTPHTRRVTPQKGLKKGGRALRVWGVGILNKFAARIMSITHITHCVSLGSNVYVSKSADGEDSARESWHDDSLLFDGHY
jgi:hypothetical protein